MNTTYLKQFITDIFAIDSPTGYTHNVMKFIDQEATKLGYQLQRTNKGNGYIVVPGTNTKTIGLSAHVDTLGLMVRSITAEGHLALTKIGGIITPTLDGEYCKIYTRDHKVYTGTILSTSPAAHVYPDANTKERTVENLVVRIDEEVSTKDDVLKLGIQHGDFVAVDPKTIITDSGFVKSRFIDDKISVAILFTLLKELKETNTKLDSTTVFLISTYEEVGHGMASLPIKIDELISVDMGCIGLDLACKETQVSICAKDSSGPYDYHITSKFIELAKRNNIDYAVDIYPFYDSDSSAALSAGNDVRTGLIGPGVHASHGMERTHLKGIEETIKLLGAYLHDSDSK